MVGRFRRMAAGDGKSGGGSGLRVARPPASWWKRLVGQG